MSAWEISYRRSVPVVIFVTRSEQRIVMDAKTALATSSLIASLGLIFPTANAADEKIFPGSVCQPSTVEISGQRLITSGGGSTNSTVDSGRFTQTLRLDCPLVRDTVAKRWKNIYVRVRDNSSIAGVVCTANNWSSYRTNVFSTTRSTSASFRGDTELAFPRHSFHYGRGSYNVSCNVPGNRSGTGISSAIHSIRLVEE